MRAFRATLLCLFLLTWVDSASASGSPRFHTIAAGQRLGSIAKRYGVSLEALCTANGIERSTRIRAGQKLLIPSRDDKDGSITRRLHGPPEAPRRADARASTLLAKTSEPNRPATHRVYAGQRLETIARRYHVSIEALCEVNRITRRDKLKPGQVLLIPGTLPEAHGLSPLGRDDERKKPATKPGKRGYVEMATYTSRYRGVVFDKNGKVTQAAIASISKLFGATGKHPRVDPRLIALIADVSEHFGGRPLRIVSGYRDHSYFEDSRHRTSKAVDFSIPGVSNTVLRDYLRRFRNAGVGYYPNSTFIHLDVREGAAYWVDYAGPGEAPRSKPRPDPKEALAARDRSGPVEESQTEVQDRDDVPATPSTAVPTTRNADITTSASYVAPKSPPEAP